LHHFHNNFQINISDLSPAFHRFPSRILNIIRINSHTHTPRSHRCKVSLMPLLSLILVPPPLHGSHSRQMAMLSSITRLIILSGRWHPTLLSPAAESRIGAFHGSHLHRPTQGRSETVALYLGIGNQGFS
jgi:hypothetical protein